MNIVITIVLGVLVILNIYASYRCYRDVFSTVRQRIFQIMFVWSVPFFGAALVLRLLTDKTEKGEGKYPLEPTPGDEFVTGLGRQNRQGYVSSPDDNFHSISNDEASQN